MTQEDVSNNTRFLGGFLDAANTIKVAGTGGASSEVDLGTTREIYLALYYDQSTGIVHIKNTTATGGSAAVTNFPLPGATLQYIYCPHTFLYLFPTVSGNIYLCPVIQPNPGYDRPNPKNLGISAS